MKKLIAALPAIRPPFLLLAPICVCFGASIAIYQQLAFNYFHFILALIGGLLAAISVNTFNEYQDYKSGLDLTAQKTPFSGGSGLLCKQPELATTVLAIAIFSSLVLFLIGCYFFYALGSVIVAIGSLGLAIIWLYTQWLNKIPFACLIAPGVGFGLLIVVGSYFVITGQSSLFAWQLAIIPFLLINNLLLLNQYPDLEADKAVGRNHLVIKYGVPIANITYLFISILAIISIITLQMYYQLPLFFLAAIIPALIPIIVFKALLVYGKDIAMQPKYMVMNVVAAHATPVIIALTLIY